MPRPDHGLFGGWDFSEVDARSADIFDIGYRSGVPMGGTLTRAPTGGVPSFLIQVAKDPLEANLERVQMIKGWLDASGKTHQKVADIALSEGRTGVFRILCHSNSSLVI
jgi:hypothetical protein